MAKQPHLFLDCDGVLADFDTGARLLFGMSPKSFEARHGRGEFWKRLASSISEAMPTELSIAPL